MGFNSGFKGLKSDKNNGYFTWTPVYIYSNISLNPSDNEKFFGQNFEDRIKAQFYIQKFFFLKILPFII